MTKQSEETLTALMGKDISYIRVDIMEIKESIRLLGGVYATKAELKEIADKAHALEKSSNIWKFLSPTLAAISSSVVTFLAIQFLLNTNI